MGNIENLCINTIRMLAIDMVERAKSGHPGMPLGAAPMAYVLWTKIMYYNPEEPNWFNRDRFILSAGHGSALLYALLYLTGFDLKLSDLKRFRQWGSKTPGHPEYGLTPGVEVTTGPLGQGFAMGVGMAIAEKELASCFNRPSYHIVNHYVYGIVSDGDLMEGISSEAASLAGTLRLGKLIYLYDDNHISIEGDTHFSFTEDVRRRFEAYGWDVTFVQDGNNVQQIERAIKDAKAVANKPSLIIVRTHIGYGSPKQDTASAHGEPLGREALQKTKRFFGWPVDKAFYIPPEVKKFFQQHQKVCRRRAEKWKKLFEEYRKKYPAEAALFIEQIEGRLPEKWYNVVPKFDSHAMSAIATREASGKIMNEIENRLSNFIGGSADLAPSTKTMLIGYGDFGFSNYCARNIHFGVREHAMGAIVNGIARHGGLIPYGSTFLVFSDYMRPALRLAALMKSHSIFIFTHDSIALGQDGPTHQPVEHLMCLRAIPNLLVIRPADANETAAAWIIAIERKSPVALILTRQKVPVLDLNKYSVFDGVKRGAYILEDDGGKPDIILIATGSEVHLALKAYKVLRGMKIRARIVSMPSWELFEEQPREYRNSIFPPEVKARLAIEAGSTLGWEKWVGCRGAVIGIDRFGASAPGEVVMDKFGFNLNNIVHKALDII